MIRIVKAKKLLADAKIQTEETRTIENAPKTANSHPHHTKRTAKKLSPCRKKGFAVAERATPAAKRKND